MSEEIVKYEASDYPDGRPLTAVQIRAQVNLIQEVMSAVMKDGHHYGKIPGAGEKPTLLKPGAEKLIFTFRYTADPQVEDLSTDDAIRYRVLCRITDRTGHYLGAGVGECSSDEEKYKWRAAVCDEEWNETPEDRRREKWRKGREKAYKVKQVRTESADIANTILKMAKKRSLVDGALTFTAASDIFTQDIEDLPPELRETAAEDSGNGKQPLQKPKAKDPAPAPAGNSKELTVREKLMLELAQYCPDPAKRSAVLKELSSFKTDQNKDKWLGLKDISDPKSSEKWIQATLGKLRKRVEDEKQKAQAAKVPANCTKDPSTCEHSKFGADGGVYCQDEKTPCAHIPAGGDDVPL